MIPRLVLFLLVAYAAAAAAALPAPDAASLEQRLASLRVLVESSSAAREIEASGNAAALARRSEARQSLRLAAEALAARDLRSASVLAENAARQLIAGARIARGETAREDDERRELAARTESARALLAAQRRIGAEKHDPAAAQLAARIEALLEESRLHAEAGRLAEARRAAEQAYLSAKAAVTALRGGDTLVRSLHFASKEEEYHYELDRNDTHRMLLGLLAQRGARDPGAGEQRAQELRRSAEAQAAQGRHAEAIRLLEDSTRELVRAIRAAGLFIPG